MVIFSPFSPHFLCKIVYLLLYAVGLTFLHLAMIRRSVLSYSWNHLPVSLAAFIQNQRFNPPPTLHVLMRSLILALHDLSLIPAAVLSMISSGSYQRFWRIHPKGSIIPWCKIQHWKSRWTFVFPEPPSQEKNVYPCTPVHTRNAE
jgi:hypothetical protein